MPNIPIVISADVQAAIQNIKGVTREVKSLMTTIIKTNKQAAASTGQAFQKAQRVTPVISTPAAERATGEIKKYTAAQRQLQPALSDTSRYLTKQHKAWQVHSRGMQGFINDIKNMMQMQARWFLGAGILTTAAASFVKSVRDYAKFEQNLKSLQIILGATDEEMVSFASTIRMTGKETVLGANDAGRAALLFAQAGLSVNETAEAIQVAGKLMSMPGANLAAVVKSLTTIVHAFKYEAKDVGKIADVLAKSVDLAAINMEDLGTVFNFLASQSSLAGIRLEEVMALVVALSRAGVSASTIGTGLSQMITELIDMSPRLEKTLRSLDLDPAKFRLPANNIMNVLEQLQKAGINITTIFEGMEVRSARALSGLVLTGTGELRKLQAELTDSGYLATFWAKALGGTEVKTKLLWNSITDLGISIGENLNPTMKSAIALANQLATAFAGVFEQGGFTQKQLDEMNSVMKTIVGGLSALISGFRLLWEVLKFGVNHVLKIIHGYSLLGKTISLLGQVLMREISFKDAWAEFKKIGLETILTIETQSKRAWDEMVENIIRESLDMRKKLDSLWFGKGRPQVAPSPGGPSPKWQGPPTPPITRISPEEIKALEKWAEFLKKMREEIIKTSSQDAIYEILSAAQIEGEGWLDDFLAAFKARFDLLKLDKATLAGVETIRDAIIQMGRGEGFTLLDKESLDIPGIEVLLKLLEAIDKVTEGKVLIAGLEREEGILNLQKNIAEMTGSLEEQFDIEKEILRIQMMRQLLEAATIDDEAERIRMGELITKQYWEQLAVKEKFTEAQAKLNKDLQRFDFEGGLGLDKSRNIEWTKQQKELLNLLEKKIILQEEYDKELARQKRLIFGQGGTFGAAIENFVVGWKQATRGIADMMKDSRELGQETANILQDSFSDAFYNIATGYQSWFDQLDDGMKERYQGWAGYVEFLKDTADNFFQQIYNSFMRTLANMWARWLEVWMEMLIMKAITGMGGYFGAGATSTTGVTHSGGYTPSMFAHQGGPIPYRYHTGGLMSDEVPLIAQTGEFVMSRRGVSAVGVDTLAAINSGSVSRQKEQVVHNHFYIHAIDSKSFAETIQKNPAAIIKVLNDDLRTAGSTRYAIRENT